MNASVIVAIKNWIRLPHVRQYLPKSIICLSESYTLPLFFGDLKAGLTVGLIALPLAIAFAIGSGVPPERGLYTAIIAGFLISLFGGSRVQIGGPTGAYIVLVYATVQKHGLEGLILATLLAGVFLLLLGILRLGSLVRFIPYPVITGFTAGIATVICISQIKDFCGLSIDLPATDSFGKIGQYVLAWNTLNPFCLAISIFSLALIISFRLISQKIPGSVIAIIAATVCTSFFELPIETIESKFGQIAQELPSITMPFFSLDSVINVLPDAIVIACLGAIESLLSAVVADRITGFHHKSNCELIAQGIGNIGSALFGGIPATGAIARTMANIQMGGTTPMAGMIHALILFALIWLFAPLAVKMPLATLAACLVWVAWNMSERHHFAAILKGPVSDRLVLLSTYLLTVCVDLVVAVQVGFVLATLLFLKAMSEKTTVKVSKLPHREEVAFFEIEGPIFFAVADLLNDTLKAHMSGQKAIVLGMKNVSHIDSTGLYAIKQFRQKCEALGVKFSLTEVRSELMPMLQKAQLIEYLVPR